MKTTRRGEKRLVGRPEKCPSVERARERGEGGRGRKEEEAKRRLITRGDAEERWRRIGKAELANRWTPKPELTRLLLPATTSFRGNF